MIPLTSTLTTITAIIVAYGIVKYGLMAPVSFSIRRKIIAGFLVVVLFVSTIGIFSSIQSQDLMQRNIGEGSRLLARESMGKVDTAIYHRIEDFLHLLDFP